MKCLTIPKLLFSILLITSCTSPRDILSTGKVTPKGQIKVGGSMAGNISLMTANELKKTADYITEQNIEGITNTSNLEYTNSVNQATKSFISYALDPIGLNSGFHIKYGLITNLELGYRKTGGVNVFSTAYQFLGGKNKIGQEGYSGWYGSIGLQYSSQNPDKVLESVYLDKFQPFLNLSFKKKDILVPLIFSKSFGSEEKYGAFSFGLAYNYSSVSYGFAPVNLVKVGSLEKFSALNEKFNYSSFGFFTNIKVGYNWVHFILSLNGYYQNVTGIKNLEGREFDKISGLTFIPSLGLEFNLNRKVKN
jgi:hypothetical protein